MEQYKQMENPLHIPTDKSLTALKKNGMAAEVDERSPSGSAIAGYAYQNFSDG